MFPFRLLLSFIYFKIRIFFLQIYKRPISYDLCTNGFLHIKNKFTLDLVREINKDLKYNEYNFVYNRIKISDDSLKKIYSELYKNKILDIVKEYLGKKLICYDNSILTLGKLESTDGAWQPHHDNKGNRIKIYIWLDEYTDKTHPLYYKKSSHKIFKFFNLNQSNKYKDYNNVDMEKFYGDVGDIIIFDTNGVHSNFKTSNFPRSVVELTFENFGIFSRINDKSIKGRDEIKRLSAFFLENLIENYN